MLGTPDAHPGPAICATACFFVIEAAWIILTIQRLVQDWGPLRSCPVGGFAASSLVIGAVPTPVVGLYVCACIYQKTYVTPWRALDLASGLCLLLSIPAWGSLPRVCTSADPVGQATHAAVAVDATVASVYLCVRAAAIRRSRMLAAAIAPYAMDETGASPGSRLAHDPVGYADL